MQYATFLERVTRNRLALNLSVFSNMRRIAKPEIVEPDHNLRLRDRGYVPLERKGRVWVMGRMEHGDGMLRGMERFISRSETHLEMFLECDPGGLEAAGASGELLVDWLRAHNFAVMAIDEKPRRLVPLDSIDLRAPSFGGELVRAFNLYCSRN
jgi:hypothetical protein